MIRSLLSILPPAQKSRLRGWYFGRKADLVRRFHSYDAAALKARLLGLGIRPGDTVLVHTAYGPLLGFQGSPSALIDAYLEAVGPEGNLLMVSLPYGSATSTYLSENKVFDIRSTPSRMGLVSEIFRRRPGVVRSLHPTHPVLAFGPKAEWIVAGHEECIYPCGPGTPFGRLLELNGKVVLHGVTGYPFTFFHYLEDMVKDDLPFALYESRPHPVTVVDAHGQVRTVEACAFTREAISRRRGHVLYNALGRRGQLRRDRIGKTRLVVMATADTVACTKELASKGIYFYEFPKVAQLRSLRMIKARIDASKLERRFPPEAKAELGRDRRGLRADDPGVAKTMDAAVAWICRAQDLSASADGGVAHAYHLLRGWSTSYPETTGYIIPTFLDYAKRTGKPETRLRAERMLQWLQAIQLPGGGFQGGRIDSRPVTPVAFNTGQILIGLATGERELGGYGDSMRRAADWLVAIQDPDGCWRRYWTAFAGGGVRTIDTHVASGLFEAARVDPGRGYAEAACRNVDWALTYQHANGWFDKCSFNALTVPLTHTLGYALRGVLDAYRFTRNEKYLVASRRTADGLLGALGVDGYLSGTFNRDWSGASRWSCLTGTAQIATCWFMLFEYTGDVRYRDAALKANAFVRRTMSFDVPPGMAGGVKGSFPVDGDYRKYQYPNWAAKFLIDSLMLESDLAGAAPTRSPSPFSAAVTARSA